MKDPIKYNVFENDDCLIGQVKDVLAYFKEEIFMRYLDYVDMDDCDYFYIKSMLNVMFRLREFTDSDRDLIVRIKYLIPFRSDENSKWYQIDILENIQGERY